jgi:DNA-binding NtrC family response regulator
MRRVQRQIDQHAVGRNPVVIIGAEGTGKELVARALHAAARRRPSRFVVIDCETAQIDVDLFGAAAGFRPALAKRRIGHLEAGPDVTVFLDNIAAVGPEVQERLLSTIESGFFQRMGEDQPLRLETRIVVGARQPLADLERQGRVGRRLRMLLQPAQIVLPPLRERLEDLPLLAMHFLRKARGESTRATSIDPLAYRTLMSHTWSGNVRELRAVIEEALTVCEGEQIMRAHLRLGEAELTVARGGGEREWILDALRRNRFRRSATAEFLGISRKTLYNKMKALGLPLDHRSG